MDRRTFLGFLMVSLLMGSALAVDLPSEGQVVLVSAGGVVAGTGMLERGDLELELLAGFDGFATMTVIGEAEDIFVYDVMVRAGGAVVLTETLDDLATLVRGAGGEFDVSLREGGTPTGGETAGAAGVAGVVQRDDAEPTEPTVEVPDDVDDVKEAVEDHVGRTSDEVGDVDTGETLGGGFGDGADELDGAGDGAADLADDGADGRGAAGAETETEPSEPSDAADRQGEEAAPGADAVPTPEVPRLP